MANLIFIKLAITDLILLFKGEIIMKKNYSSIRLEITSHCNLMCEYCHNSKYSNRNDDMTTEEIMKLICNLKKQYPINKILLTGGEPLVNKDICKIISFITSLGIKADMVTNGTLLTPKLVNELETAGLKRIRLSIDEIGYDSKLRDMTNPNELWKKAEMISKESKIEVCIHTVCSPSNVNSLFDVYLKTLEVGAKRWRVFDLGYQGGITENKEKFSFDLYYDSLIKSTKSILSHYLNNDLKNVLDIEINNIFRTMMLNMKYEDASNDIKNALAVRAKLSPCDYVADHQLSVRSNGVATLCQYFHNDIFNFKEYNFNIENAIMHEKNVIENELLMSNLEYCSKCKYCLICNSGCRSRAQFLTDDITDADPGACYIFPRVHNEIIPLLPDETRKVYNSFVNHDGLIPKYSDAELKKFLHNKGY